MLINDIFQSYIIRNVIFEFLTDKDKLIFTSCDKFLYSKRTSIIFVEEYYINEDDIFWKYYNQLTKVRTLRNFKFPTNLVSLEFTRFVDLKIKIEDDDIPATLSYLKINETIFNN